MTATETWHPDTRWHAGLLAVFLVALAARVTYALAAAPNILPISDAGGYRLLGQHLAEGLGYIRPYDFARADIVRPTAEFPPGFPSLLALFHAVGLRSVEAQRLALGVLGALAIVGIALLARRWFSRRGALLLGAVAAVHPALFAPESALLAESLFLWLVVLLLLAVVRYREDPRPERAVLVGLLGGAGTLVRSEGFALAVLLVIPLLVTAPPRRIRIGAGVAVLVAALLLPGAWALRNLATFDEPVLVSNNLGSVLAGANCDRTYDSELIGFWYISEDCFDGFRQEALEVADESVVAKDLRDDGVDYARNHLGDLPKVAAARVLRTFQMYQPEQQGRLATFEGRRLLTERITSWILWATLPLALAGTVHLGRARRWVDLWLLTVPIGVVVLVAAATYGNPRFRIAAEVPLLILAGLGVRAGVTALRGRLRAAPA